MKQLLELLTQGFNKTIAIKLPPVKEQVDQIETGLEMRDERNEALESKVDEYEQRDKTKM